MSFIKVHDNKTMEKEIYINIKAIEAVYPFSMHDNVVVTRISTLAADQPYFHVSESVDEVMQMIRRSELCLM